MARKFLQMGYTRSRRYANHRSGKKYDGPVPGKKKGVNGANGRKQLPFETDEKRLVRPKYFTRLGKEQGRQVLSKGFDATQESTQIVPV